VLIFAGEYFENVSFKILIGHIRGKTSSFEKEKKC